MESEDYLGRIRLFRLGLTDCLSNDTRGVWSKRGFLDVLLGKVSMWSAASGVDRKMSLCCKSAGRQSTDRWSYNCELSLGPAVMDLIRNAWRR
jgi:hypothetical protein